MILAGLCHVQSVMSSSCFASRAGYLGQRCAERRHEIRQPQVERKHKRAWHYTILRCINNMRARFPVMCSLRTFQGESPGMNRLQPRRSPTWHNAVEQVHFMRVASFFRCIMATGIPIIAWSAIRFVHCVNYSHSAMFIQNVAVVSLHLATVSKVNAPTSE